MKKVESILSEVLGRDCEYLYCVKTEPVQVFVCRSEGQMLLVKLAMDLTESAQLENEYHILTECKKKKYPVPELFCFHRLDEEKAVFARTFIEGSSVDQLVESGVARPGLTVEQSIRIIRDVLRSLMSLHGMTPPVIHRDIKPQNVIVDKDGMSHLVDFGIARTQAKEGGRDTNVLGTSLTAPPEQYGYRQTDGRSDIYSTGVLLRYCLTGEYDENADEEIPGDLRKIVRKATQFDPDNRYQTARDMLDEIDAVTKPDGKNGQAPSRMKNMKLLFLAAAACICVVLASLIYGSVRTPVRADTPGQFDTSGNYHFCEPLLEEAVRTVLGDMESPLTEEMLSRVKAIHIFGKQIYEAESQIDFLGQFVWMKDPKMNSSGLWRENGGIVSLDDIRVLTGLEELCLYGQSIEDISVLKDTHIASLGLGYNPLTDLTPLYGNPNITSLNISCLSVNSLSGIESMTNLRSLNISETQADDFSPLSGMAVRELNIFETPLKDESILAAMTALESLTINKLHEALLAVLPQIACLKELTVTHANGYPIEALTGLGNLEKLYYYTDEKLAVEDEPLQFQKMKWIDMKNVQLTSLRCVSEMTDLETLLIYASQCDDYTGLDKLTKLSLICCTEQQMQELIKRYPDRNWTYSY